MHQRKTTRRISEPQAIRYETWGEFAAGVAGRSGEFFAEGKLWGTTTPTTSVLCLLEKPEGRRI